MCWPLSGKYLIIVRYGIPPCQSLSGTIGKSLLTINDHCPLLAIAVHLSCPPWPPIISTSCRKDGFPPSYHIVLSGCIGAHHRPSSPLIIVLTIEPSLSAAVALARGRVSFTYSSFMSQSIHDLCSRELEVDILVKLETTYYSLLVLRNLIRVCMVLNCGGTFDDLPMFPLLTRTRVHHGALTVRTLAALRMHNFLILPFLPGIAPCLLTPNFNTPLRTFALHLL